MRGVGGHVPHRMSGDCLWGPPFGGFKKVAVVSLFCFIPNLIFSGKECLGGRSRALFCNNCSGWKWVLSKF